MLIDGFDLTTLGLAIEPDGISGLGGIEYEIPTATVPGLMDAVELGAARPRPRTIDVAARVSVPHALTLPAPGDSVQVRIRAAMDELLRRLDGSREVQLVFPDVPDRFYVARCLNAEELRMSPALVQRHRRVRLRFFCRDPRAWSTAALTVANLHIAAQPLPMGEAPLREAAISITGPVTNPYISLRADAVEISRLEFTGTLAAGEVLTIDLRTQYVRVDGVVAAEWLTGGDFFILDPAAGALSMLVGPTASAASITYRRAWR